ncbi:ProQ/FINO family protein [Xylophilus ampelinus]|uniref:ProQ/FINO family protein n=1 Tax=Xylophilus ampelinus TaxID=54067 RepID=A0A318SEJ3_9BURK|nr:ProQ/FINO family protein [Xylophilus ampelinus]MCS4511141.1 ProQ/FINO family protein [Xylophilus ampelinus]PYE75106.1 ProQ/FINO family protein [Xylophilus ampelinus]
MTDSVPDAAAAPAEQVVSPAVQDPRSRAPQSRRPADKRRSQQGGGGRGPGRRPAAGSGNASGPSRAPHPALEQLAGFYPQLFGAVFRPLKRGIFQDLLAAHPDVFEREALKTALGLHTRSTRYLQSVAAGDARRDLQGAVVEDLAPEHVHHALVELWRRREGRTPEADRPALRAQWRDRMVQAFEASGLTREDYAERVRTRNEAATGLLDEALAEAGARAAKDEALLRAFESGSATVEAFADMYGLDPRQAGPLLERARRRRSAAVAAAAHARPVPEGAAGGTPASEAAEVTGSAAPRETSVDSGDAPATDRPGHDQH